MKFTLSWLKKFLDTTANIEQINIALNAIGIEVDSIIDYSKAYEDFIVAKIESVTKHPKADSLNCCKINDGKQIIDVITAASNVRENLKTVFAPIGTIIPTNNLKIEARQLRGIPSYGMLCSADELALEGNNDGIMELENDIEAGEKIINIFPRLREKIIEVSITPDRADCLGIYGIARDLAAYGIGKLKPIATKDIKSFRKNSIDIAVDNHKDCPLFIGRYFKNVQNKESPEWLKSLLFSIGENPISALVDITNYISYSFGRPLHVYDADKITGNVTVRSAQNGEKFLSLKGEEYHLSENDLVVADQSKVIGLAGIMGGNESKCEIESRNIYLEAAVFERTKISKTSRTLNINSEAKHIFERGVDHNFTLNGAIIASNLIYEICGGEASNFEIVGNQTVKLLEIQFNLTKVELLSGIKINTERIIQILIDLGFIVSENYHNIVKVKIPSWRHDVSCEEDLVEEVLRIYGYDKIPYKFLNIDHNIARRIPPLEDKLYQSRCLLASQGYHEIVTFSFMSSHTAEKFGYKNENLLIENPISTSLNSLRQSAIPNILSMIQKNNARSLENISFVEIGPIFKSNNVGDQFNLISGIRSGNTSRNNLYQDTRKYDFFDVKKDVLELLNIWNIKESNLEIEKNELPKYFHPGKSASLKLHNKIIAYIGEIHPSILADMKIKNHAIAFELFIDYLIQKKNDDDIIISNYQAVYRDFAFIVSKDVNANSLVKTVKSVDNELIRDVHIFDVYNIEESGENAKSIAINITLQAHDRTLANNEILNISKKIIEAVQTINGGKLREI